MEMLYYTIAAIFLYVLSDWILNRIETRRGERFRNRSLVFFVIILVLALIVFNLIQQLHPAAQAAASAPAGRTEQQAGSMQR